MQGYHHSVCIHLLFTLLSNVLYNRRIKNKCLCIAQPDQCLQMQKILWLIHYVSLSVFWLTQCFFVAQLWLQILIFKTLFIFTLVIAQCFICLNWNMLGRAPQIASAHEKIAEDCLTNILTTTKEASCSLRTDLVSSGTFRSPSSSSACTSLQ